MFGVWSHIRQAYDGPAFGISFSRPVRGGESVEFFAPNESERSDRGSGTHS
jgi:hypothetical protein